MGLGPESVDCAIQKKKKKHVMARVVDKFITPPSPSHSSLTPPIRGLKKGSKGRLFD